MCHTSPTSSYSEIPGLLISLRDTRGITLIYKPLAVTAGSISDLRRSPPQGFVFVTTLSATLSMCHQANPLTIHPFDADGTIGRLHVLA